jgi:hypothetical protein
MDLPHARIRVILVGRISALRRPPRCSPSTKSGVDACVAAQRAWWLSRSPPIAAFDSRLSATGVERWMPSLERSGCERIRVLRVRDLRFVRCGDPIKARVRIASPLRERRTAQPVTWRMQSVRWHSLSCQRYRPRWHIRLRLTRQSEVDRCVEPVVALTHGGTNGRGQHDACAPSCGLKSPDEGGISCFFAEFEEDFASLRSTSATPQSVGVKMVLRASIAALLGCLHLGWAPQPCQRVPRPATPDLKTARCLSDSAAAEDATGSAHSANQRARRS